MAKTVKTNSIAFHFKRRDFERWTNETLHDPTLARRISKLKKIQSEEKLREEKVRALIYQITKNRLGELKNMLPDKRHNVHSKTLKARKHKNTKETNTKATRKKDPSSSKRKARAKKLFKRRQNNFKYTHFLRVSASLQLLAKQ